MNIASAPSPQRVLIVTPQPFYEDRGTPIALLYVLKALSELGFAVDMIAFPIGREVEIPRVKVHRLVNPLGFRSIPIGFSFKKVFLDFFLFWKIRQLMRAHTYRYVHAVEEAALIVLLACRRKHILLLYDMASSLPEQLANLPVFRMKPIRRLLDRIEKWLIFKADYIVCSRGLLPHIEKSGGKNSVCEWWFPTIIKDIDVKEKVKIRTDLGIGPNDHLFVYAGSFAPYQGIELLLDAVVLLRDHPARPRFLLAGATPEELSRIQVRWGKDTPPNVTLLGRQAKDKVLKFLASADFLISPRRYGANTPLKVFDYMGAGKPIIASDIFAHRVMLDESRAVFFKNSAESLASAITDLVENRHKAIQLAEHSKAYAQAALTWPRFLDDIKRITSELGAAEIVKFGAGFKP